MLALAYWCARLHRQCWCWWWWWWGICGDIAGNGARQPFYPATNCHQMPPTQPSRALANAFCLYTGGPSVTQPQPPAIDDTPGRKRSQPIAIELPSRSVPKAYTPLSARGDLPGFVWCHFCTLKC
jgi:hypothetical protein